MRAKKFKYNNQPTELDGHRFDSKREANRYAELKLLQMGGKVRGLKRQVRFRIDVHDEHICDYIADFCYEELQIDFALAVETLVRRPIPERSQQ